MFFIFLKQNLIHAQKNFGRVLQNVLFFLIACSLFFLLAQNQSEQGSTEFLMCNIIWFSLLFSMIFANSDFLAEDYRDGTVEQMIILCPNLETYIISKIVAAWIIFCLPILAIIPLMLLALGLNSSFILHFVILISLASLAINFICAFCGSLNVAGNSSPMLAILALPLIVPVLLIACGGSISVVASPEENVEGFYFSLKLLSGICVFVGATLTIATTKIVKIVSE